MRGLGAVGEGEGDDRQTLADGLGGEDQGEGVADPGGPFVDRVACGRRDDDGIRCGEHSLLLLVDCSLLVGAHHLLFSPGAVSPSG
jgi:hypothetical protein